MPPRCSASRTRSAACGPAPWPMSRCSPTSAALGCCATTRAPRLPPSAFSARYSACAPGSASTPTRRSCRWRRRHDLPVADEWQALLAADVVDDLQHAFAVGAVLDAEFLHQTGVVDQVVARQFLAAGLLVEGDLRVGQEL